MLFSGPGISEVARLEDPAVLALLGLIVGIAAFSCVVDGLRAAVVRRRR